MDSLTKALELKPNYIEALGAVVVIHIENGRHAEAVKTAQKVQTLAPKDPIGFLLEGDARFDEKRFSQAETAYEKAFTLRPTGGTATKIHAAQTMAGNPTQADAKLLNWMNGHPTDVTAPLYWAGELAKKGKNKQAIDQYQLVLKQDPNNFIAMNNLAAVYQRENDPRALSVAEEAFNLKPDSPAIADTLGWILVERGEASRGLELIRRANRQAPGKAQIRYHLAAALASTGDRTSARKELEDLLAHTTAFPERDAAQALLKRL
jgi:putative PEP-CTERM system TPR-repeat lipoprotein